MLQNRYLCAGSDGDVQKFSGDVASVAKRDPKQRPFGAGKFRWWPCAPPIGPPLHRIVPSQCAVPEVGLGIGNIQRLARHVAVEHH